MIAAPKAGHTVADIYADYALSLQFADIPADIVAKARHCLVDALGCALFGRTLPWSRIVLAEATETGSGGPCRIPGEAGVALHPPQAALVLGAFCHAFELDSLRKPGVGVHPGATVALPAYAIAQATGASDDELLTAIVAGSEVMFRIGMATLHSPEHAGFHAPGLTGPFGAAIVAGRLMGLDPGQMANALGIAGSLAGGLLAFAPAGQGGMIKRLHLGRAAEAGVTAARLAARGFEAPHAVIEGRFGLLDAYCSKSDPSLLLDGLGAHDALKALCLKRYACHITAHAPTEALRDLMAERGFAGDDIASVAVRGSAKLVSHHSEKAPADIMLAQYSTPFVVALAAYHDPEFPGVFATDTLHDPRIRDLAARVDVAERSGSAAKGWGVEMEVVLRDGTRFELLKDTFSGTPDLPFSDADLARKYRKLCGDLPEAETLLRRFLG